MYVCEGWVIAVKPHFHSTVHRDEMRYEPTEECMVGSKQAVLQVTFTPNNAGAYAGATPGKPVACQHRLNARAQQGPHCLFIAHGDGNYARAQAPSIRLASPRSEMDDPAAHYL